MEPAIPEYITVHLGAPDDASARNIRVPFTDYIKNVASSEIYPDWPESAIRANIYAQISYALNRIYTEWYRSRGYDFDITNTTQFDQKYTENGEVFDKISGIVDQIFDNYVVRQGSVEPLFAQFCDGVTTMCPGLSQWGTVSLAEQGYTPYQILQHYYGDNINIQKAPVVFATLPSYPGRPLKLGDRQEDVRVIQIQLNRIAQNYPAITTGLQEDGFFDTETRDAVTKFQEVFNIAPSGEVDETTWYTIKRIYTGVKGLGDLFGEGLTLEEVSRIFERALGPEDSGNRVRVIQYYLGVIGFFDENIPQISITGVYDRETQNAVRQFQEQNGIAVDGIIGRDTWNAIVARYNEILSSLPEQYKPYRGEIFPGRNLAEGMTGEDVRMLQELINKAAAKYPSIPVLAVDGIFGPATDAAVRFIQQNNGYDADGIVGPLTWNTIVLLGR